MSGDHNMHCSANQPDKETPLALRLAEYFETTPLGSDLDDETGLKAAAELRRLYEVNAELVEALKGVYWAMYVNEYGDFSLKSDYDDEPLRAALDTLNKTAEDNGEEL